MHTRIRLCVLFSLVVLIPCEARMLNVRGKITYQDGDPVAAFPTPGSGPQLANVVEKPARFIEVLVRPEGSSLEGFGRTDNEGVFSIAMPIADNVNLDVLLKVNNDAVQVWADTEGVAEELVHPIPGTRINSGTSGDIDIGTYTVPWTYTTQTVSEGRIGSDSAVLTLSFGAAINISEVIFIARHDALTNMDPAESDTIGQVQVEYCDDASNHYLFDLVLTCALVDGQIPPRDGSPGTGLDSGYIDHSRVSVEFAQDCARVWDML